jgi:hypothetical protein
MVQGCGEEVKPHRTTPAEFARFKREALRLIDKLGIKGWRVVFLHEPLEGCYGDMHANHMGRIATIRYSSIRDNAAIPEDPERVARHEVLELFLARFEWIAEARWGSSQELGEEKHNLIRTLENLL